MYRAQFINVAKGNTLKKLNDINSNTQSYEQKSSKNYSEGGICLFSPLTHKSSVTFQAVFMLKQTSFIPIYLAPETTKNPP